MDILKLLSIACLSAYWVLFGVWASIKFYHYKGEYTKFWIVIFFIFNIFGYVFFRIKCRSNKRVTLE